MVNLWPLSSSMASRASRRRRQRRKQKMIMMRPGTPLKNHETCQTSPPLLNSPELQLRFVMMIRFWQFSAADVLFDLKWIINLQNKILKKWMDNDFNFTINIPDFWIRETFQKSNVYVTNGFPSNILINGTLTLPLLTNFILSLPYIEAKLLVWLWLKLKMPTPYLKKIVKFWPEHLDLPDPKLVTFFHWVWSRNFVNKASLHFY